VTKSYSAISEKNLVLQLQFYCGIEEGRESVDASLGNEMNKKATVQWKLRPPSTVQRLAIHLSITELSTAHLISSYFNCCHGSLCENIGFCTEAAEKAPTQSIPLILLGGTLNFCWHLGTKGRFSTVLGCCN